MPQGWTAVKKGRTGPDKAKELVNNHADCIKELQDGVDGLRKGGDNQEDEIISLLVVDDTEVIRVEFRGIITERNLG